MITENDVEDLRATLLKYVPQYYDQIDDSFVDHYLHIYFHGSLAHATTTRVEIWKAAENNVNLGYLVLVWKRWGTMKTGPWVIKQEFQGLGLGRGFQSIFDKRADETMVRKAFHTLPARDRGHVILALTSNFIIEAHLQRHYGQNTDELIVGRRVAPYESDANRSRFQAYRLLHLNEQSIVPPFFALTLHPEDQKSRSEIIAFLKKYMPYFYYPVDYKFIKSLSTRPPISRQSDYSTNSTSLIVVRDSLGVIFQVHIARLKRGRVLKSNLIPSCVDYSLCEVGVKVLRELADAIKARKITYEFPVDAIGYLHYLRSSKAQVEGILKDPYKDGIDMFIASEFRR